LGKNRYPRRDKLDRSKLINEIKASMGTHAEGLAPETIKKMLESMTEVIIRSLRDKEPVRIDRLFVLKPFTKKARSYYSPSTGKQHETPTKNWVKASWSPHLLKGIQP
jgi:nucleoid DNA-binding protein